MKNKRYRPSDVVRRAYLQFDEQQAASFKENDVQPSCGKGCYFCCYEPVYAERQEALVAIEALNKLPAATRDRIRRRAKIFQKRLAKAKDIIGTKEPNALEYRKLRLACPFLEGTECSIYADRPLGCRSHVAVGPAIKCSDEEERRGQTFVTANEATASAFQEILYHTVPARRQLDHFGLLVAEILTGKQVKSADWQELIIKDGGVQHQQSEDVDTSKQKEQPQGTGQEG